MTEQEKDFKTVLFEGLGLASMCWSETPKGVFDDALAVKTGNEVYDAHLSDRDQFAIGFAEWKEDSFRYSYNNPLYGRVYVNINTGTDYAESKLLDLYKQSLTKTDKK
jgi:hypothetical protein